MSEGEQIVRRAAPVSVLTVASRVAGVCRDSTMAFLLGAGGAADAFYFAFMIPNLFRRLLAEGAMSVAFIPVFSEYKTNRTEEETRKLYNVTFSWFFVAVLVFTIAAVLLAPLAVRVFAWGYAPHKKALTEDLAAIMFPYILLVALASLFVAVLHIHRHFIAPAAGPILFNCTWIAMALLFAHAGLSPVLGAAAGVLAGGVLHLLLQVSVLRRKDVRFRFDFTRGHPAVGRMLRLMAPVVFGVAIYQINALVSYLLASLLADKSVSFLYFANRFAEFPLGVFAVSIATVALPSMARSAAMSDIAALRKTYASSLRMALFVCVPSMAWLAVMRVPLVSTFLEHGKFLPADTPKAAGVILATCAGIWAVAGSRITAPAFYSLKEPRVPVMTAAVAFLVNAVLGSCVVFATDMGVAGLALAGAAAAAVNFALLLWLLRSRLGSIEGRMLARTISRVVIGSAALAAVSYGFSLMGIWSEPGRKAAKLVCMAAAALVGGGAYLSAAWVMGMEETGVVMGLLKRKTGQGADIDAGAAAG